jgi:hypothetical protein
MSHKEKTYNVTEKPITTTEREIGNFLEELSRIQINVGLIEKGKTHTKAGLSRLTIIYNCADKIQTACKNM